MSDLQHTASRGAELCTYESNGIFVYYVSYSFYSLTFLLAKKLYIQHNVFWVNVM